MTDTFNWTKVELKPSLLGDYSGIAEAFNWTKVELKLIDNSSNIFPKSLLIELR